MKKILFYLIILLVHHSYAYSQLYINCYTTGDTINDQIIMNATNFSLDKEFTRDGIKLVSFSVVGNFNGTVKIEKNKSPFDTKITPEMKNTFKQIPAGKYISIEDILIEKNGENRYITKHLFYKSKTVLKKCSQSEITKTKFKAKILGGKNQNVPIKNQRIILKDTLNNELKVVVTDQFGDFYFDDITTNVSYTLEFETTTENKNETFFLAKNNGEIINPFKKNNKKISYNLSKNELKQINSGESVDLDLKIKKFQSSNQSEITIFENLIYESNSDELGESSKSKFDKIVNAMQENKSLKLCIESHTDSKGQDDANFILSNKRAEVVKNYLISKGINKERLNSKGFGEKNILNRCKNNVECSELEHELNRRTEFKFSK